MKKKLSNHVAIVILLAIATVLQAQNDTTNDTWRIENEKDVTDSPTIITNNLGLGTSNFDYEDGLHLLDKSIFLQKNTNTSQSATWRVSSSWGGVFWIQNMTNNVNAIRVERNGNMGLTGASLTPEARLHVKSYNQKTLLLDGGAQQNAVPILQTRTDDLESIFAVYANHKVGIGTTSPNASLHITPHDETSPDAQSGLIVRGDYNANPVQIINTHEGNSAGGLSIETSDQSGIANALSVLTNRGNSPNRMLRVPNSSGNGDFVLLAEDGGRVGIGTSTPENKLDVCGRIRADEVVIEGDWCDYVFAADYQLPTILEQKTFINTHGHLKNFQSEEDMNGQIQVGDIQQRQQKTIEEMMLYLIALKEEMEVLKTKNEALEKRTTDLEKENAALKQSNIKTIKH